MATIDDLKSVLSESLENKGVLSQLKAKLRAEIFEILEDNSYEKPRISQENLLINELFRDYLEFNHYKYTKSVFLKESNQSSEPLNREVIAAELGIQEDKTSRQVPLIYSLLWHFLNKEEPAEPIELTNPRVSKLSQVVGKKTLKDASKNIQIYDYTQKFE